jgi:hypothetical protein
MVGLNSSVRIFGERSKENHVKKAKSIVSISIFIGVLLFSMMSIPVQVLLADPASYTLQAQKKDSTWTTGLVSGYVGCENVPFRLRATYGNPDKGQTFIIKVWGASVDTDTPTNRGIDYLAGFTYSDPDSIIASGPTINTFAFPYAGGASTGTLVTQPDSTQNLEYTITFTLESTYSGTHNIRFFWGAHLALSPFGAAEWIGPPTANIQGGATPPSGGVKTVNIQKPGVTTVATDFTSATTDFTSATTDFTSATTDFTSVTTDFTSVTTDFTSVTTDFTSVTAETRTITTEVITQIIEEFEDPVSGPVGGYVMPVNKLSVISPYLVILGMIACLLTMLKMSVGRKD